MCSICMQEAIEQVQMHAFCMFFWGWYLTPKGMIIDDGVGISTSSVGGKSEARAVLV